MSNILCVILYNQLTENPGPDEADVLDQVNVVKEMLLFHGVEVKELQFSLDLAKAKRELELLNPDFVFNLVESVNNKGSLVYLAPSLLSSMRIPYTGSLLEPMFVTSSKTLAKERMLSAGIPTAQWFTVGSPQTFDPNKTYIVKPLWEDGSLGLDEHCVFSGANPELNRLVATLSPDEFFVEEFIDGREFNISILANGLRPQVLSPAEIIFDAFPAGKPKVVGYTAKWVEDSFEYKHTNRTFNFSSSDSELLEKLCLLTERCWDVFSLNGYARVDFRVDSAGNPIVLEINANPCISPDSGFYAACEQSGIAFAQAVKRIVNNAQHLTKHIS